MSSVSTRQKSLVVPEALHHSALRLIDSDPESLLACEQTGRIVRYTVRSSEDRSRVVIVCGQADAHPKARSKYVAYLCGADGSLEKWLVTEKRRLRGARRTKTPAQLEPHEAAELYGMLTAYQQRIGV